MRNLSTSIVAGGLSVLMSLTAFGEARAMPMPDLSVPQTSQSQPDLQQVRWHGGHGHVWRGHGGWHHGGWHRGGWHHGGGYYGGGWHHRGWHHGYYRGGYYNDGGAWVPLAAFAAGAIIAGAASHPAYRTRAYHSHASWCASRYRTYRASDNTYQPTSGPRRQCR
jgi:hypothetical protein